MSQSRTIVVVFAILSAAASAATQLPPPGLRVAVVIQPDREDERIVRLFNRDYDPRTVHSAKPSCKCVTILNTTGSPTVEAGGTWSLRIRLDSPLPDRVVPGVYLSFGDGEGAAMFVPVLESRSP